MSPQRAILDVRGLRKSYGTSEVLKGIDLRVEPKELVFIMGPSGSTSRHRGPISNNVVTDAVDDRVDASGFCLRLMKTPPPLFVRPV